MALRYITVNDIRVASGAPTALISDADLTTLGEAAEYDVERWLNSKFTPTVALDVLDGTGTEIIITRKKPLLTVRGLKTNDTSITLSTLENYRESGRVVLGSESETPSYIKKRKDTKIQYVYGWVEPNGTQTTSTAATAVGTSVAISVTDEDGFTDGKWVRITGLDGNEETAQISSTASGIITVDQLVFTHESGSLIEEMDIPEYIKRYIVIEAGISVGINAIGATYVFNASYNLGELQVTKGVPYTHWRESVDKLLKERAERKSKIRPRTSIR